MAAAAGLIYAAGNCLPHEAMAAKLTQQYQEVRTAYAPTNAGGLMELYEASNQGTWTLIITTRHGVSCMVAAGENWRHLEPKPKEPEA